MATHYSVLAWRIPGMAEPGGLPSMGSHRVGHNLSDLAADKKLCTVETALQKYLEKFMKIAQMILCLFPLPHETNPTSFFLLHWKRSLFLWVPDEVIYNYLKFSCWKTIINVVLVICWIYIQLNFHKSNATGVFLLKDKKYRPSKIKQGFPCGASGKELTCQCRRHIRLRFYPWFGKIPWRKKWQPTSTLAWRIPWTEEPGGLQSMES